MSNGVFALVPVKDPRQGKSRLAGVLDAGERSALNAQLARQTFECCASVFGSRQTVAVTASEAIAAEAEAYGLVVVRESAPGDLNAALVLAAEAAIGRGARALLVVPTDLVLLTQQALRAAARSVLRSPGCLLAPDRRATGTNLMGIMPARADLFRFGERSLEKHRAAAREAGLPVRVRANPVLALDLDSPEDYSLWRSACCSIERGRPTA